MATDSFHTRGTLDVQGASHQVFRLSELAKSHPAVARLPFSLKVLLENLLRHEDGRVVRREHVEKMAAWDAKAPPETEISFHVARVLLQDFTGVPAVVDLAAMREAMAALGGDAKRINPRNPADLVIDHSVQVDHFGSVPPSPPTPSSSSSATASATPSCAGAQQAFNNFRVVPPDTGICHQVNLEYLAQVVFTATAGRSTPTRWSGTDSHTTMINGLGVVGWGVGGIEAEAAHARPAALHAHPPGGRLQADRGPAGRARPPPTWC